MRTITFSKAKTLVSKAFPIAISIMLAFGGFTHMQAQDPPAFPGAEGYGAIATGGRGGEVIEVTNLNNSGEGSLRAAINASGPRTIVFRVGGIIELESALEIKNGDVTIAGQTAPGDGICIKNYNTVVKADNVIIRFIRFRLGDDKSDQEDDAIWGRNQDRIIIDHCSMSWSVDEVSSFYDNSNFTMQYCILSEALYNSIHGKGEHSYGGIWGGQGATFHHNLLAHNSSRNPRFNGSRYSGEPDLEKVDHRNNVIYNWGGNSAYGAEGGTYNLVNNYYKSGNASSNRRRICELYPTNDGTYGNFYVAGNYFPYSKFTTEDNWGMGMDGISSDKKEEIKLDEPFDAAPVTTHSAQEAYEHVLMQAGAVLPKRDPVDERIVNETRTGTTQYGGDFGDARGIIDTPSDVGGYPEYESGEAPTDTDGDGMPDEWEEANGLNPNTPVDRNETNDEGYTNLEVYLNSLVEDFEYLVRPIEVSADAPDGEATVNITWNDISDNETAFIIERSIDEGDWQEVASVEANTTSYSDEDLSVSGTYDYRMKAVNEDLESHYTEKVSVLVDVSTGILETTDEGVRDARLTPNPVINEAQLFYSLENESEVNISVFNFSGQKMLSVVREKQQPGSHEVSIPTQTLNSGSYFVNIRTSKGITTVKMIVK